MPTRSGRIQNSNLDRPRSPGGGPAPGNSGSDRAGVGWVSNPTGTSSSAQSGSRFGLGPGGFQIRPPRPALGTRTPLGNRHRLPVRFPIRLRRSWSGSKFGLGPASVSSPARPPENFVSDRICGQARVGFEPDRTGRSRVGFRTRPIRTRTDTGRWGLSRPGPDRFQIRPGTRTRPSVQSGFANSGPVPTKVDSKFGPSPVPVPGVGRAGEFRIRPPAGIGPPAGVVPVLTGWVSNPTDRPQLPTPTGTGTWWCLCGAKKIKNWRAAARTRPPPPSGREEEERRERGEKVVE